MLDLRLGFAYGVVPRRTAPTGFEKHAERRPRGRPFGRGQAANARQRGVVFGKALMPPIVQAKQEIRPMLQRRQVKGFSEIVA